jgi:hypothetical protein
MAVGSNLVDRGPHLPTGTVGLYKTWTLRKAPAPSPAFDHLYGISCASASSCIAVGVTGAQQTLEEHWNGSQWLLTKLLNP